MSYFSEKLSPHFSLGELCVTSQPIDNTPTPEVEVKLRELATAHLERIRARFGPLAVNSGYRSPAVNAATPGSAPDSAHCYGCAADLHPLAPGVDLEDIIQWVVLESGLDYDQVIHEKKAGRNGAIEWVHYGILRPNHSPRARRQALRFDDQATPAWSFWTPRK